MSIIACRWPDCDQKVYGRGFCKPHHMKSWKLDHVDEPWVIYQARADARELARVNKQCKWPECETKKLKGYGMCLSHYRRATVLGNMDEPWKLWRPKKNCDFCGRPLDRTVHNKQFCTTSCFTKHYRLRNLQMLREAGRENSRRRHAMKLSTQVEKFTDKEIRLLHGDGCYICGKSINYSLVFPHPKSPSVDHVQPLSAGGPHILENCAMAHLGCNLSKNAATPTKFPQPSLFSI